MNVALGVGEVLTILVAITGLAWTLLKLTISQFERRLNDRFVSIDGKLSALDGLVLEVKKLEIEQLRRDTLYSEKFVSKMDNAEALAKQEKATERMIDWLEKISEKLDRKVDKDACESRHK